MTIGKKETCLYCLTPDSYEMKLDKKNKPYFICSCCGCRTFLRGEMSLRGPSVLWGPLASALRAKDSEVAAILVGDAANAYANV
jgi:hypothetical protein